MSKFIKLSKLIINTSFIRKITIETNIYHIELSSHDVYGFGIFGSGMIDTNESIISICANKNKNDYIRIDDWIKNNC